MSSKKQKKQKGKTLSLQEFAASLETETKAGKNVIYAPKEKSTIASWADEVEEDELTTEKVRILLPSAPRASRGPDFDENQIPMRPPFTAHVGNISYDIDEEDIREFFSKLDVDSLRLPRDEDHRLRGFGYVVFKTREDLIEALCMNEHMLRGRPIRISIGAQTDGHKRGGGGRNIDETPDDWRTSEKLELGPSRTLADLDRGRSDYGGGRFDFGRNSDYGGSRGGDYGGRRDGDRDYGERRGRSNYDFDRSDFGSRRGGDRDNNDGGFRRNYRDDGPGESEEGTWRRNPAEKPEFPPQERDHRYGGNRDDREIQDRDRRRYGSRDQSPDFRDARNRQPREQSPEFERPKFVPPPRPTEPRSDEERERESRKPSPPRERKKLVIAPRTVTESSGSAVPSSAIFGGARPVDTAAREREIERKLEEQNLEPRRIREESPPPKSESQPPQPERNAWTDRRERQEIRSRDPPKSNENEVQDEQEETYRVREEYTSSEIRGQERDDAHSPPPDSDTKDTNSEPEDERDLRLAQEEEDDFQRVERRRKPKVVPPSDSNYNPRSGEYNRGSSGGYGSRGRGGIRRGN